MDRNGLFSNDQSDFLLLHSTLTCLLKILDDWYRRLDLGKLVGLVFIELKKDFDKVYHSILCQKLQYYGDRQRELSRFISYLSNRKQFCRLSGTDSKVNDITIGVPQGSCLGPLLRLPLRKSTVGQKGFSYRGTKVWNSLSTECKEARSLRVYKSFLK